MQRDYNCLYFYTYHEDVAIYLEDKCIYKTMLDPGNPFGKTSGSMWHKVFFSELEVAKEVKVVLTPQYKTNLSEVPVFYYGNRLNILEYIIRRDLIPLILSIVVMLAGLSFVAFAGMNRKNPGNSISLVYLGVFSLLVGIWKLRISLRWHCW